MRRRRTGWIWGGRIAAMLVVAGLAVYLFAVGLDKTDKLVSVLSLLVAVVALVAPYLLPTSDKPSPASSSTQSVVNTVVGGHLTQVQDAKDIRVQGSGEVSSPQTPLSADRRAPGMSSGQYVDGVWRNLTQDGADGDERLG